MVLFIIGLLLSLASLGYLIYTCFNLSKNNNSSKEYSLDKKFKLTCLILSIITGISTILSSIGLSIFRNYDLKSWEYLLLIFGSFLLGGFASVTCASFILYYYLPNLKKKERNFARIFMFVGFALTIIGLWVFTEGIANQQQIYPLINGINFTQGFTKPDESTGGFQIKFYGIIIVCGALICYFYTDHNCFRKYGEHGLIDTLFIVAFLSGIVGARLWSCFILEPDYFLNDPLSVITEIQRGGLAIQGGAILGMATGIAFVLIFRKYMDVRYVMDIAIPTILLAQALGRWGNFFNQEVYGFATTREALWFLPTIVKNNMFISGEYRVPLFFIEGLINITGYFFIRYFLGKLCRFNIGTGYQAASYCIWYGIVRISIEGLRDSNFEYNQSKITAIVMIVLGLLWLGAMITIHSIRKGCGFEDENGDKIKKVVKQ